MKREMLQEMTSLMRTHDTCVLATSHEGRPHCSLMAYAVDEGCEEIYMVTHRTTRKYRNLMANPHVSLLIDTREEDTGDRRPQRKALTVTGAFCLIEDEDKRLLAREGLLKRHPYMATFLDHPEAEIFSVKVTAFLLLEGPADAYFLKI